MKMMKQHIGSSLQHWKCIVAADLVAQTLQHVMLQVNIPPDQLSTFAHVAMGLAKVVSLLKETQGHHLERREGNAVPVTASTGFLG